jgi:hypothetical protein
MKEPRSEHPARELPPDRAWESKDHGLGPQPERYSPEWMEWIENRALVAGMTEALQDRKKQGR